MDTEQPKSTTSNQIIIAKDTNINTITLYLPTYLRFKVKDFISINFETLNGQVNLTLLISVKISHLPPPLVSLLKTDMKLLFSRDGILKLSETSLNNDIILKQTHEYLHFTVRKIINAKLEPYVFFTPFEIIDMVFTVCLKEIVVRLDYENQGRVDGRVKREGKSLYVRFNLMDCENYKLKYNFGTRCGHGNYRLAEKRVAIEYDVNETPNTLMKLKKNTYNFSCLDQRREQIQDKNLTTQQEQQQQQQYFHYSHIHLPLYRKPLVILGTIFIPLWLLAIINLAIFYQQPQLSERISNIAVLMTVFIAIIPYLRDKLPPNPMATLIQVLIYLQVASQFLALVNSLVNRQIPPDQYEDYKKNYNAFQDPEFIISIIITLLIIIVPLLALMYHYCCWISSHREQPFPKQTFQGMNYHKQWKDPKKIDIWKQKVERSSQTKEIYKELDGDQRYSRVLAEIEKQLGLYLGK